MKILISIVFTWFLFVVNGQTLSAYWLPDSIPLGGQTRLCIVVKNAPKQFKFSPRIGTIQCAYRFSNQNLWKTDGSLEILSFHDSLFVKNGIPYWKGIYRITAWDTAHYRFPLIQLPVAQNLLSVQPPLLHVGFVKKKVDDSIEEIPVHAIEQKSNWWIWICGLACILGGIGYWSYVRNKKANNLVAPTLKKRTLDQIDELEKKRLWESNQLERHYVTFSKLIKAFIGECYGISLKERTTQEVQLLLKANQLDETIRMQINELLLESDGIKFGKNTNQEIQVKEQLDRFRALVVFICPIETHFT